MRELKELFRRLNDPNDSTCVACRRAMRPDEKFGRGPLDWDRGGRLCPECWDKFTAE